MIDWQLLELRRNLADWLWSLFDRAIFEKNYEKATEAHRILEKVYDGDAGQK